MSTLVNRPSIGSVNSNEGQSDNNDSSQYRILTLTFNQDCTYDYYLLKVFQRKISFSRILEH